MRCPESSRASSSRSLPPVSMPAPEKDTSISENTRRLVRERAKASSAERRPPAKQPPTTAPIEAPAITSIGMRRASSSCSTPICDQPRAAPAPSATPMRGRFGACGSLGAPSPAAESEFDGALEGFPIHSEHGQSLPDGRPRGRAASENIRLRAIPCRTITGLRPPPSDGVRGGEMHGRDQGSLGAVRFDAVLDPMRTLRRAIETVRSAACGPKPTTRTGPRLSPFDPNRKFLVAP